MKRTTKTSPRIQDLKVFTLKEANAIFAESARKHGYAPEVIALFLGVTNSLNIRESVSFYDAKSRSQAFDFSDRALNELWDLWTGTLVAKGVLVSPKTCYSYPIFVSAHEAYAQRVG